MRLFLIALVRSFGYAFEGLSALWRTQRNIRIQAAAVAFAFIAGLCLRLSLVEWLAVVLVSTLVLSLEAMNTALETVVDLVTPEFHPLAKRAKDIAAGAVLLAAIGAVIVAALIVTSRFAAVSAS